MMKRSLGIATVAGAILLAMCISGCTERDPKPAIQEAHQKYLNAALDRQGATAVEALSERTVDYYDKALKLALHGDIEQLNAVPVPQRMLAITIRHEIEPEQAKAMSGADVLAWFVEGGRMAQEAERNATLENIQVTGDEATADYVVPGYPTPFPRVLRLEGPRRERQWKTDLIPTFESFVEQMMERAGAQTVDQENELIFVGLSLQSKKPMSRDIWNPPYPQQHGADAPLQ